MLFKEKLLLSNCDSVRALDGNELRKRFLTGLAFADGVVLSPNALIDNAGIAAVISQSNVTKYLNEEGQGKLVIRGFGMDGYTDVRDYYHARRTVSSSPACRVHPARVSWIVIRSARCWTGWPNCRRR